MSKLITSASGLIDAGLAILVAITGLAMLNWAGARHSSRGRVRGKYRRIKYGSIIGCLAVIIVIYWVAKDAALGGE
ncbi:hypothetical protein AB0I28_32100 [Phytomonospora sp. NPDC050363]|uniref:hypothetical protein n=1 Tax=Phytomonospora sp. NPDC050363 TaxID=3155642 RepID=UPI0033F2C6F4